MGEGLRDRVKERYAGAALTVLEGAGAASCCGSAGECGLDSESLGVDWTGGGYSVEELEMLSQAAGTASLGCGNPTALATLSRGNSPGHWQRWRHRRFALGQEGVPRRQGLRA